MDGRRAQPRAEVATGGDLVTIKTQGVRRVDLRFGRRPAPGENSPLV